jgi:predicted glutamine amidotransferase
MCRLFGLSAAPRRVHATFWLLEAPDSLARQSRREPDGTGLGTFTPEGTPTVQKQPLAAYEDAEFAKEAKQCESTTFLAHVRYASTGGLDTRNTHPFEQRGGCSRTTVSSVTCLRWKPNSAITATLSPETPIPNGSSP